MKLISFNGRRLDFTNRGGSTIRSRVLSWALVLCMVFLLITPATVYAAPNNLPITVDAADWEDNPDDIEVIDFDDPDDIEALKIDSDNPGTAAITGLAIPLTVYAVPSDLSFAVDTTGIEFVNHDDYIEVPIVVSNNPGTAAITGLIVSWDSDQLMYDDRLAPYNSGTTSANRATWPFTVPAIYADGGIFEGAVFMPPAEGTLKLADSITFGFAQAADSDINDTLVTLKFKVKDTATGPIKIELSLTSAKNQVGTELDFNLVDGNMAIPTYTLAWDGTPGSFAPLSYGYGAGSTVTYSIENTGNQTVTGIAANITAGGSAFEISTPLGATSLAPGAKTMVTVRTRTGQNAGTYNGTLTLTWTGGSGSTGITQSLSQTINKVSYNGTMTASDNVIAGQATPTKTLTLPTLPAGASYPASGTVGGTAALISSHSISGTTLTYSATSQTAETSATITIPVTNATNYSTYNVVVTITAKTLSASLSGHITGFTGLALTGTQQVTVNLVGDTFAGTLSGNWITGLPAGLSQSVTRVNDTTARITVSGTPTAVSASQVAVTIPTGALVTNSGIPLAAESDAGSVYSIVPPTYTLAWDGTPGSFAPLSYGYGTGSTVTYSIENIGNQTVTGIAANITAGGNAFEISTPLGATSLAPGAKTTVTVRTRTGQNAGTYNGTLALTWTGGSGSTGITRSLSQTVNKVSYAGIMAATKDVHSDTAATGITFALPSLPSGASYGIATASGSALVFNPSVSGLLLTFDVTAQTDGIEAEITIPVANATNYDPYDFVVTVRAKDIVQEATPFAAIDFMNEWLTGFDDTAAYTINGTAKTSDTSGNISIDSAWIGQTVTIIKKGIITSETIDSDPQVLLVPARSAAPTPSKTDTTGGNSNGTITGVDATMEYKLSTASIWIDITGPSVTGLSAGTYSIREKATSSTFASTSANVTIASSSSGNSGNTSSSQGSAGSNISGNTSGISSNNYGTSPQASSLWAAVNNQVNTKQALANGTVVNHVVITGRNIIVPINVINNIQNGTVALMMNTGLGVTFSISGSNAPVNRGTPLDLSVRTGDISAPKSLVQEKTAGTVTSIQVPMEKHQNFGLVVNMHYNFGADNADNFANLYRYNPVSEKMEYLGSSKLNEKGQAVFGIHGGAEYIVTVSKSVPNEAVINGINGGDGTGFYTVVSGDTMSRIAVRNGMRLQQLVALNPEITDINKIRPGQRIRLR